jgi:hypothetical protein
MHIRFMHYQLRILAGTSQLDPNMMHYELMHYENMHCSSVVTPNHCHHLRVIICDNEKKDGIGLGSGSIVHVSMSLLELVEKPRQMHEGRTIQITLMIFYRQVRQVSIFRQRIL